MKSAGELSVDQVLDEDGLLQEYVEGFQVRHSQLEMARLIEDCIARGQSHVIEASTGIGKSFAYLAPAFLASAKVLISTGTRNLQDQLFQKDIPLIRKIIASGKQVALLKGRSNYACHHRIQNYRRQRRFQTRRLAPVFDALTDWCATSNSGDIAEFADIPENDSLWFYATSTADNCLGGDCPQFGDCFVVKARRKAMDADLVVINHHLFFSDQALRDQGFGELLPDVDVLIFDEAHQLPDIASHFYGKAVTLRQFETLARDALEAQGREARDAESLQTICDQATREFAELRVALSRFNDRGEWRHVANAPQLTSSLGQIETTLNDLQQQLETLKPRGRDLAACHQRLVGFRQTLGEFLQQPDNAVSWYEWNAQSFRLSVSPVDISAEFNRQLESNPIKSLFFTSATLSSNRSFDYFKQRLGIDEYAASHFDSPFDYASQAMLYLPDDLAEPADERFADAFVERAAVLIRATSGNAFVLFTSYRMLTLGARKLGRKLTNKLFVQGEMQRGELLRAYLSTPSSVLLGTSSFWEGVDVKGDRLKLVIIDKLPFKSPGDPLYKRRLQACNEQGGNAFRDIQVPEAIISLRQGVGRLIRDANDRGIVMIADRRLTSKPYGRGMVDSLPAMKISRDLDEVLAFAQEL
jgi:ATP-dependent DNA helicase DinG